MDGAVTRGPPGGCVPLQRVYRRLRFGESIIVVSGLPRSGTSMAMRMLAAGGVPLVMDGIRTADEDNPNGYFEDERVKNLAQNLDKKWLQDARGKAIKIIAALLENVPDANNYKLVFMRRNLHEVLASQAKMLARRGEPAGPGDDKLLEFFEQHLKRVLAGTRARPCFEVCELEYKQVVEDPRPNALRLQEFLGRPLDVDAMARAVDPALFRNRR
jgi:hypothetical protein